MKVEREEDEMEEGGKKVVDEKVVADIDEREEKKEVDGDDSSKGDMVRERRNDRYDIFNFGDTDDFFAERAS